MKKIILAVVTGLLMLNFFSGAYATQKIQLTSIDIKDPSSGEQAFYKLGNKPGPTERKDLILYEHFNGKLDYPTECQWIQSNDDTSVYVSWEWKEPAESVFDTFSANGNISIIDSRQDGATVKPIHLLSSHGEGSSTNIYGGSIDPNGPSTCIVKIPFIYKSGILIKSGNNANSFYQGQSHVQLTFSNIHLTAAGRKSIDFYISPFIK